MSAALGSRLLLGAAALLLISAPGPAEADAEDREIAMANLLGRMGEVIRWNRPTGIDDIETRRTSCRDGIKEAKAEGVRSSDVITSNEFGGHPKAKKVGKEWAVKVSDLGWFCDDLDLRLDYWDLITQLEYGFYVRGRIDKGLDAEEQRTVTGDQVKTIYDKGKRCSAALATQLERGLDPTSELDIFGKKLPVSEAAAMCLSYKTYGDQLDAAWQVRFVELAKKYQDVGIKGDRLDLFVFYDGVEFYLKGCKSSTSDPKKLKKAKVLFQWLTDSASDQITIRKYTFKGDKYKVSEKQYWLEAKAYRGCK